MAVALAAVTGASSVWGNKRQRVYDLTFSGNYATNGESITAASVGLNKIEQVYLTGNVAAGSTPATGTIAGAIIAADGRSVAIRHYELGGTGLAGDPLAEKNNAEAYIAGTNIRASFVGR